MSRPTPRWDTVMCPERDQDFHDPVPASLGDWLTPETVEVHVECSACGAEGVAVLDLHLRYVWDQRTDW